MNKNENPCAAFPKLLKKTFFKNRKMRIILQKNNNKRIDWFLY